MYAQAGAAGNLMLKQRSANASPDNNQADTVDADFEDDEEEKK